MPRPKQFHLTLEYKEYNILCCCTHSFAWGIFEFSHTIADPNDHVLITRAPFTCLLNALRDAIKVVDTYTELEYA